MVRPTTTANEEKTTTEVAEWVLPPLGDDPSSTAQGTTPGSFANKGRIGTPWTFSSPDTPGMPQPSEKTAWDFLPDDWEVEIVGNESSGYASSPCEACAAARVFTDSLGVTRRVTPPAGFEPITQLEHARLGVITPEMARVATRE